MKVSGLKKKVMYAVLGLTLGLGCSNSQESQSEEPQTLEVSQQEQAEESPASQEESLESKDEGNFETSDVEMEAQSEDSVAAAPEPAPVSEPEVYQPDTNVASDPAENNASDANELVSLEQEPASYDNTQQEVVAATPEPAPMQESVDVAQNEPAVDHAQTANSYSGESFEYRVIKGDSVSRIAKKIYGSLDQWQQIAEASHLKNPAVIRPGQKLVVPLLNDRAKDFAKFYNPNSVASTDDTLNWKGGEVVVKAGDTLSKIAAQYLKNSAHWKAIFDSNQGHIKDPNTIYVGQKIKLPNGLAH